MIEDLQTNKKKETGVKRIIGLRAIWNIYGLLTFSALAVSIFVHPVTENIEGFVFFILISSAVYFSLVNLYYLGSIWKKVIFVSLFLIALFSILAAVYTIKLH